MAELLLKHPERRKTSGGRLLCADRSGTETQQPDAAGSVLWGLESFPNKQGFHVTKDGYFPAYHMNKEKWLSIQLGKPKLDNAIKDLLSLSYELTAPKKRDRKSPVNNSGNPANGKAKETNEG